MIAIILLSDICLLLSTVNTLKVADLTRNLTNLLLPANPLVLPIKEVRFSRNAEMPLADGNASDDLIFSGAGSGCFDDEDECNGALVEAAASGDDLITPVYIRASRPTPPPYHRYYPTVGTTVAKVCDDEEDCVDGSGSGEPDYETTSSKPQYYYSTLPPLTTTTRQSVRYQPPPIIRPPNFYYPAPQTTKPPETTTTRPTPRYTTRPTTIPPEARPIYPVGIEKVTHPPIPKVPQGPPTIYEVPLPEKPVLHQTERPKTVLHPTKKPREPQTALVIGLIAVVLMVIVIIVPVALFIKMRYRSLNSFKLDGGRSLPFNPVSGAPPMICPNGFSQQQTQITTTDADGNNPVISTSLDRRKPLFQMSKKRDLKEWYV